MGTSQSSKGPGSGVPMVPSWVDNPPPEAPQGDDATAPDDAEGEGDVEKVPTSPAVPLAPDRRWLGVRRSLGDFASSGDTGKLRTGFGRYARDGYGGSRTAARPPFAK